MNVYICDNTTSSRCSSLIARAHVVCKKHDISFVKYILDDKYSNMQHLRLKRCFSVNDGLCDTVSVVGRLAYYTRTEFIPEASSRPFI